MDPALVEGKRRRGKRDVSMLHVQRNVERHGEAIRVNSYEFSPVAFQVDPGLDRTPFYLRWMSPTAVRVRHPDGWIERIAIRDRTRWIQVGVILGAMLAGAAMVTECTQSRNDKTQTGNLDLVLIKD
jgi:hypothetical protein